MNKVSLIKVNDYCKHLRRCCTLLKTEKQYTKEGMKPSAFSWMQVAKYLTPLGKRLQHPSGTYEKALAQLLSKCIGRHWQSSGCERSPGGRESVEAARQIHCCGQKIVSPNERVVCLLYSGFSLFSGTNFRPENTIQSNLEPDFSAHYEKNILQSVIFLILLLFPNTPPTFPFWESPKQGRSLASLHRPGYLLPVLVLLTSIRTKSLGNSGWSVDDRWLCEIINSAFN